MATFNKVNTFTKNMADGVHNLSSDTLKGLFTNAAPVATNTVVANLTDIAAGNGYLAGGVTIDISSSAQVAGVYSLVATDEALTASGGSIGPFRYVAIYNSSAASSELIGWYDYGSSITLNNTETFSIDFGANLLSVS